MVLQFDTPVFIVGFSTTGVMHSQVLRVILVLVSKALIPLMMPSVNLRLAHSADSSRSSRKAAEASAMSWMHALVLFCLFFCFDAFGINSIPNRLSLSMVDLYLLPYKLILIINWHFHFYRIVH